MKIAELINGISVEELYGGTGEFSGEKCLETEITGLFSDSRACEKDGLFFCLTGGEKDGHSFAVQALKKGAVAIVCEKRLALPIVQIVVKNTRAAMSFLSASFFGNPAKRLKIVAITGTNGKTTTAHMLSQILKSSGKKVGVIGTLGIAYGDKRISSALTTPDPVILHATFADMVSVGVEYVVMEASAHALYYHKLAGISFCSCIFTNFTQDHLDFFKTMNAYRSSKIKLFTGEKCEVAIVNGDDNTGNEIVALRRENGEKTVVYGLDNPADAFAVITHESLYGSEIMLNISDELCRVTLGMAGRHNIYNALAAAVCAKTLGIALGDIREGLESLGGVSGRLQYAGSICGGDIFVDFAHTPDGLEKSLAVLKKHCKGRLICLFGCGGNRDKSKRPIMGETVAKRCDFAVLTSDNPRYEDPLDIIADIEKGYRRFSMRYVIVPKRKRAISYAIDFLKKGDILLVAGKGGEEYQEVMGIKYPFDDNDIIEKTIREKRAREIPLS